MKKKCPSCDSRKTVESRDYFSCQKCGYVHKKTDKEKDIDERHSPQLKVCGGEGMM